MDYRPWDGAWPKLTTETAHADPMLSEHTNVEWECDVRATVNTDGDAPPQITNMERQGFEWKFDRLYLEGRLCRLMSKRISGDKPKTVIYYQPDGLLEEHKSRWQKLAQTGNDVEIRGWCTSGCTLIMAYVPSEKICFDQQAILRFHAVRPKGSLKKDLPITEWMVNQYPQNVRTWIENQGGAERMMVDVCWVLRAYDLWAMGYHKCEPEEIIIPKTVTKHSS